MRRLATRIGKDGVLRIISQQTRSQAANREFAVERFVGLMRDALLLHYWWFCQNGRAFSQVCSGAEKVAISPSITSKPVKSLRTQGA